MNRRGAAARLERYVYSTQGATSNPTDLQQPVTWNEQQTLQRLQGVDSVLPGSSSGLTIIDPNVVNPSALQYQKSLPVLTLKNKQALDADPIRGDVPITFYPEIGMVGKSRFDKDSLRLDGAFSYALDSKYKKLSAVTMSS